MAALTAALALAARAAAPAAIYDDKADAAAQISRAVRTADRSGLRVLVDFGANWCGDCRALDANLHRPENAALLARFVVVHVSIGRFDKNLALAARYGVPLDKGVPALAVLDGRGRVIYAQKNGEFEDMRRMDPAEVGAFLRRWSAAPPRPVSAG